VKREKKNLVPTDDGNVLITVLPDEIKSPKMTAEWEMALNHIAQNTETADEFLNGITELMQELVARYQGISEEKKNTVSGKGKRRSHWQMSPLWSRCQGRKSKFLLF